LIITKNEAKPRKLLKRIRLRIRSNVITNLVFHTQYIPIISEDESKSDALKSFLMRRDTDDNQYWKSIYDHPPLDVKINHQNKYSSLHSAFQNLDFHLFRNLASSTIRSKIKNIYRGVWTLGNYYPNYFQLNPLYIKRSLLLINYPFLSKVLFHSFNKQSWQALSFSKNQLLKDQSPLSIPRDLKAHLQTLLKFEFIEDISVTPSIIQNNLDKLRGKIFIEILINEHVAKSKYLRQLENLEDGIIKLQTSKLKIRVRTLSQNMLKLQLENYFFTFPLETHYRNHNMFSFKNASYSIQTDHRKIQVSSVHFLISQFLRFRSLEQKTSLIGSKFVKSLNIMFRYYRLAYYLKHKEFLNFHSESEIRDRLTPQFSDIELNDIVTDEHWDLIKAQLLYSLKQIKKELIPFDRSLIKLNL